MNLAKNGEGSKTYDKNFPQSNLLTTNNQFNISQSVFYADHTKAGMSPNKSIIDSLEGTRQTNPLITQNEKSTFDVDLQ